MKKITNYIVGLSLAVMFVACGSSPEEQLYGTWEHTAVEITNEDGSELTGQYAEVKDKLVEGILDKETTYSFEKGDEFSQFSLTSEGSSKSGDFQAIELDGKIQLVLYDESDESAMPTKVTIDELTEELMKTSFNSDGMTMTYTYTKK